MARQAVSDVIGLRLEYDKACAELLLGANADDDTTPSRPCQAIQGRNGGVHRVDLLRVGDLWRNTTLISKNITAIEPEGPALRAGAPDRDVSIKAKSST